MSDKIKNTIQIIKETLTVSLFLFAIYYLIKLNNKNNDLISVINNKKIDTIYEKEITIHKFENNQKTNPVNVKIQIKKDTLKRTKAEKQKIVMSSKIENNELTVTSIDTLGLIKQEDFYIQDYHKVIIDNQGNVSIQEDKKKKKKEKIKKITNKIKNIAIGIAIGILISSQVK